MSRVTRWVLLPLTAAVLSACAVGPDYSRPKIDIPASFKEAKGWKAAEPQDHQPKGKWWEVFNDPQLNALEEQLVISNQNIALAEAQYRQAQALLQGAQAGFYPDVTGSVSKTRASSGGGISSNNSSKAVTSINTLSLNASWEIDLWGKIRRSVESSKASLAASEADLEAARLSAQSQLAISYFQLYVADAEKAFLDDSVKAYLQFLDLTRNRLAAGVASPADMAQAETLLKTAQVSALAKGVQRAQLEHAIAVLLGKAPADFSLAKVEKVPVLPDIPAGVPSQLLERRPDIASAERRVAAANAQIGVAKAAYFPDLTLSATSGYASSSFANWLTLPNRFWSVGPQLAMTLFDGGLLKSKTDQAIAVYDQSVATYRQTVLAGFQEVEDNLVALRLLEDQARLQNEVVKAAQTSQKITENQYKAGTVSYLDVVTTQATTLAAQRNDFDILNQRLTAAVTLIQALGGGWQAPPEKG
ncbi:efflux transporter outer membrane subunit [Crenobacter sp. SG2303]|uniref:Efflux transporter outer membrane subunit n=1 Tax=Crenobacter oryzisoli TaxID=3056844 RepID=A0ABT7XT59_9NEIS|nr:efflux transporter outer membrane subunit [Crenobacter sp. SG2303]MDN0076971.1 efflux transporter outer membrane subunit [Crenobacter sp. SG2303]